MPCVRSVRRLTSAPGLAASNICCSGFGLGLVPGFPVRAGSVRFVTGGRFSIFNELTYKYCKIRALYGFFNCQHGVLADLY